MNTENADLNIYSTYYGTVKDKHEQITTSKQHTVIYSKPFSPANMTPSFLQGTLIKPAVSALQMTFS